MSVNHVQKFKIVLLCVLCVLTLLIVCKRKQDSVSTLVDEVSPSPDVSPVFSTPVPTDKAVPSPIPTESVSFDDLLSRRVIGNNVCIRDEADVKSANLDYLYYGNLVTMIKEDTEWSHVKIGDIDGFVYNKYLCIPSDYPEVDGKAICDYALTFVGTKYKWGGQSPDTGFDCSGFLVFVYDKFGIPLNRIASDQALNGVDVKEEDIKPGDIICFKYGSSITHSAIYIGEGRVIHAANEKYGVMTAAVSDFSGAKLIIRRLGDTPDS